MGTGEDTRELDVPASIHPLVLGDLDVERLSHPALVLATPDLRPSQDVGRRLAARLDALAAWPDIAKASVHLLAPRPGRNGAVIGRSGGGAELEVESPTLSRRHCEVGRDGGRWWVADLESSNGTFIEDRRLGAGVPTPIASGDLLRLGKHVLVFLQPDGLAQLLRRIAPPPPPPPVARPAALHLGPEGLALRAFTDMLASSGQLLAAFPTPFLLQVPTEAQAEPPPATPAPATPPPATPPPATPDDERLQTRTIAVEDLRRLKRGRGLGAARLFSLHGARTVVGREPGCDVLLTDASASKRHAMLVPMPHGWGVIDLESRNGTFVNGRRVPAGVVVPLKDEFQVWFGGYRVVFMSPALLEALLSRL